MHKTIKTTVFLLLGMILASSQPAFAQIFTHAPILPLPHSPTPSNGVITDSSQLPTLTKKQLVRSEVFLEIMKGIKDATTAARSSCKPYPDVNQDNAQGNLWEKCMIEYADINYRDLTRKKLENADFLYLYETVVSANYISDHSEEILGKNLQLFYREILYTLLDVAPYYLSLSPAYSKTYLDGALQNLLEVKNSTSTNAHPLPCAFMPDAGLRGSME